MKQFTKLVMVSAALVLAACDSSNTPPTAFEPPANPPAPTALLQVLHASPDAPRVNVLVDGAVAISDLDYREASPRLELDPGTFSVQVDEILPDGPSTLVPAFDVSLAGDTSYTVVAVENYDAINLLTLSQSRDTVLPGNARITVLHATAAAPAVDVYLTAPDVDVNDVAPSATFAFGETIGPLDIGGDFYRVQVTLAGTKTVVYDSGTIEIPSLANLLLAAVPNIGLGDSAVQLVALGPTGATTLYDDDTPAAAVAVHLSPDAPAVDVIADIDSTPADENLTLATGLTFPNFCAINDIPAPVEFTLDIAATADNSVVADQIDFDSAIDTQVTAIVSGFLAAGAPAIPDVDIALDSTIRSIATEAQIRLTHGSPSTGLVDIYLLAAGTDLQDAAVTPAFADVPFQADTGVLSIAPGDYDVYVTPAGDKSIQAIAVTGLTLAGGEVWDIVARDPAIDGSEGPLPLPLVIDYSNVADCPVPQAQ